MKKNRTADVLLCTALIFAAVGLGACSSGKESVRTARDPDALPPGLADAQLSGGRGVFTGEIADSRVLGTLMSDDNERAGDIHFRRGNVEMAYIQYTKSLNADPKNTRVLYKRGLLFLVGGMSERAKKDFRRVLQSDPDHAYAYMGLGQALFDQKEYDAARRTFLHALELDPGLWKCHSYLGVIHDYEKNHEAAVGKHLNAIRLNHGNGLLYNNLGLSYYFLEDYDNAVLAFRKALETRSDVSRIHNNLGLALAKAGRHPEALKALMAAGDEAQAYNNLGCIYLWQGEREMAVRSFERAIALRREFYVQADDNLRKAQAAMVELPFAPQEKPSFSIPIP